MFSIITAVTALSILGIWLIYLGYRFLKQRNGIYLLELLIVLGCISFIVIRFFSGFSTMLNPVLFVLYLPIRISLELRKMQKESGRKLSWGIPFVLLFIVLVICTIDLTPYNPHKYYSTYNELIDDVRARYEVPEYIPEIQGDIYYESYFTMYKRSKFFHLQPMEHPSNYKNYTIEINYQDVVMNDYLLDKVRITIRASEEKTDLESFELLIDSDGNEYYLRKEYGNDFIRCIICYEKENLFYSIGIQVNDANTPDSLIEFVENEVNNIVLYMD